MLLKVWKKKQTRNFRNHHIFLTFQHYYIFDRAVELLFSSWNIPGIFPPLQSIMNVTRTEKQSKICNGLPLKYGCYFYYYYVLQVYLKITQWSKKKAVRLLNGVHGHPVQWLVAKEFQWGPEVFFKRKRPKCWDVTGKWCRRKCVQHLFPNAKVILIHYLKMESTFEFWSFLQVQDSTQRLPKISCQMTCVQPPNGQDGLNVQPHAVKAMNWEQEGSLTAWAGKNVRTLTRQNVRIVQELSLLLALKAPKSPACWQVLIVLWLHGANGHLAPFPVVSSKIFLMYWAQFAFHKIWKF